MTTEDKSYWKEHSSIQDQAGRELYINTGNGDWALFVNGEFVSEGPDHKLPADLQDLWDDFHSDQ